MIEDDVKGLRRRPHPRLRHGQVPLQPPLQIRNPQTFFLLRTNDYVKMFYPIDDDTTTRKKNIAPPANPLPKMPRGVRAGQKAVAAQLTPEPFSRLRDEPRRSPRGLLAGGEAAAAATRSRRRHGGLEVLPRFMHMW